MIALCVLILGAAACLIGWELYLWVRGGWNRGR